jgi:hypothetical protein
MVLAEGFGIKCFVIKVIYTGVLGCDCSLLIQRGGFSVVTLNATELSPLDSLWFLLRVLV